ncbi:hypothetical protein [Butyrivibrio sp. FC2001]|uniref:hypothetical protein n=1 Tax=Butyrivibrio sp. FC2001 TaxID=1280671 RepID=UPI001A99F2E6|nr:hypothetical protein [Butyrivibrio sp. FC2001]
MILLIIATGIGYLYLDECSRLRKRLLKMGVNRDDISSFPKRISAFYLKDILYEKETELAEECFLTVEKDT